MAGKAEPGLHMGKGKVMELAVACSNKAAIRVAALRNKAGMQGHMVAAAAVAAAASRGLHSPAQAAGWGKADRQVGVQADSRRGA